MTWEGEYAEEDGGGKRAGAESEIAAKINEFIKSDVCDIVADAWLISSS